MRNCPECFLQLAGRTHYREIAHGWVLKRTTGQGGADQVKAAVYTGRAVCELCLDAVVAKGNTPTPTQRACDSCGDEDGPHYWEVTRCFVKYRKPGAHAPTRIVYSGVMLCARCAFQAEQGEQLELFQ